MQECFRKIFHYTYSPFYTLQMVSYKGAFFWGYSSCSYSGLGTTEYTEFQFRKERYYMFQIWIAISIPIFFNRKPAATGAGGRVEFPAKKIPKRSHILSILIKPHSFHSVRSAIGSRRNGMIFRSFRERNSSQKNTNTVYSEYSYSGIVPKELALSDHLSL